MKRRKLRRLIAAAALAITAGMLGAGAVSEREGISEARVTPRTIAECDEILLPLILMTEFEKYPADVEFISAVLVNPADRNFVIGTPFFFEKLVDGEWRIVPFGEGGGRFFAIGCQIDADSEQKYGYDILTLFGQHLTSGTYRISHVTYVQNERFIGIEPIVHFRSDEFVICGTVVI
jgi:hypothetical protein